MAAAVLWPVHPLHTCLKSLNQDREITMNDVGKFISIIIGVGFLLASMGTLHEVTVALRAQAAKDCKRGIFSIGSFNRTLVGPGR